MRLAAHGLRMELPAGWDARIFRPAGGEPTLHAASFALPARDGDFGSRATELMPSGGVFLAVTAYAADDHLRPGQGLFGARGVPALKQADFRHDQLVVQAPGRLGVQRFFTLGDHPLCAYAVVRDRPREHALAHLNAALRSLRAG